MSDACVTIGGTWAGGGEGAAAGMPPSADSVAKLSWLKYQSIAASTCCRCVVPFAGSWSKLTSRNRLGGIWGRHSAIDASCAAGSEAGSEAGRSELMPTRLTTPPRSTGGGGCSALAGQESSVSSLLTCAAARGGRMRCGGDEGSDIGASSGTHMGTFVAASPSTAIESEPLPVDSLLAGVEVGPKAALLHVSRPLATACSTSGLNRIDGSWMGLGTTRNRWSIMCMSRTVSNRCRNVSSLMSARSLSSPDICCCIAHSFLRSSCSSLDTWSWSSRRSPWPDEKGRFALRMGTIAIEEDVAPPPPVREGTALRLICGTSVNPRTKEECHQRSDPDFLKSCAFRARTQLA
mmetsp:Transcript_22087/g.56411  ORF Transcript_22087/g.56411 Transcript_22087/m.56411 type:complete len:349 (-) Transcript_22087:273-1319(-)